MAGTITSAGNERYSSWQAAEQGLRERLGSVTNYADRVLYTNNGVRVVDAYNTKAKIIGESKYGYQALTSFIQTEIARDAYLLQTNQVKEVQWHFYYSEASGTIGGSYNLIRTLLDSGIQVFYH